MLSLKPDCTTCLHESMYVIKQFINHLLVRLSLFCGICKSQLLKKSRALWTLVSPTDRCSIHRQSIYLAFWCREQSAKSVHPTQIKTSTGHIGAESIRHANASNMGLFEGKSIGKWYLKIKPVVAMYLYLLCMYNVWNSASEWCFTECQEINFFSWNINVRYPKIV